MTIWSNHEWVILFKSVHRYEAIRWQVTRGSQLLYFAFTYPYLFKNGPSLGSFSLFPSFQNTVDSKHMFNINKVLSMTVFEPRSSGIRSDRSTNWVTTTAQSIHIFVASFVVILLSSIFNWTLKPFALLMFRWKHVLSRLIIGYSASTNIPFPTWLVYWSITIKR